MQIPPNPKLQGFFLDRPTCTSLNVVNSAKWGGARRDSIWRVVLANRVCDVEHDGRAAWLPCNYILSL